MGVVNTATHAFLMLLQGGNVVAQVINLQPSSRRCAASILHDGETKWGEITEREER